MFQVFIIDKFSIFLLIKQMCGIIKLLIINVCLFYRIFFIIIFNISSKIILGFCNGVKFTNFNAVNYLGFLLTTISKVSNC
jgi:hypothetical protein